MPLFVSCKSICLPLLFLLPAVPGCSRPGLGTREVIVFTLVGNQPFKDSILTVRSSGWGLSSLLRPKYGRSYLAISGTSLHQPFVVTVHELMPDQRVVDHLYFHDPQTGKEQPLKLPNGVYGMAVLSPDRSQIVFEYKELSRTSKFHLASLDVGAGTVRELTPEPQDDSWDGYPVWRSDGLAIMYLHLKYTPKGQLPVLMLMPVPSGSPAPVLADEPVASACFSPDGQSIAMWTRRGLEILDMGSKKRTTILNRTQVPDHEFGIPGMAWAKTEDKIVFSLFNKKTQRYDLWTAPGHEGKPRAIRTFKDGIVMSPTFITY